MTEDTLGLLLAVRVRAASEQERAQVSALATDVQAATGRTVTQAFVDEERRGDQKQGEQLFERNAFSGSSLL